MSLFKKTMFALAAASLFIFAGCSTSEDDPLGIGDLKISEINATIDSVPFNHKAAAKVSNDTASGQDSLVSAIFKTDGTMVFTQDLTTREKLIVTYAGKTAGTYNTGFGSTETIATKLLDYLVTGNSPSLGASDVVSVKSNVTYIDANGDTWFSTSCKVIITGQSNGITLSLISGSFECDVYKKGGDGTTSKHVSGTIHNVVGI
ncbi:MAG: hypothetical protein Q4B64_11170 [Spirochaetales bacterium]|nr:hypothetical protein [Spirochaetales bacterium]